MKTGNLHFMTFLNAPAPLIKPPDYIDDLDSFIESNIIKDKKFDPQRNELIQNFKLRRRNNKY